MLPIMMKNGNTVHGDVVLVESAGNLVNADRGLVALVGVENTAVLTTEDATLIVNRARAQDVRAVVTHLKNAGRKEHDVSAAPSPIVYPAKERVAEFRRWLFEDALPFWAEVGLDRTYGGVIEQLNLDGTPRHGDIRRLRVAARQIYVYSHAKLMGFEKGADDVINHALSHLFNKGWHPDGGWIHLFTPDGEVKDATRDSYDQAFVIFALAWAYRATGREDLRDWIDRSLAFMDRELADPMHGGFYEALPTALPRRANPHMHYLEAMLSAWAATKEHDFLVRAGRIVDLFEDKFFDPDTWTLTEFFTSDWQTAPGDQGQIAIPGHHYEWVWLLHRFESHTGRDLSMPRHKLFAFAEAFGRDHTTHRVYDEVTKRGEPLRNTSRCWTNTEALKALLVMREAGAKGLERRIDETLSALMDDFFAANPAGSWMDQFAYQGKGIATAVPASTLYHAFGAGAELIRAFEDPDVAGV